MPWIEGNFSGIADAAGIINYNRRISSPFPVTLQKYKVKTITGCNGRNHSVRLTITRSDDPANKIEIDANIQDCNEYSNNLEPNYHIQSGKNYDLSLRSEGFNPNETVEGSAGLLYSIFLNLNA